MLYSHTCLTFPEKDISLAIAGLASQFNEFKRGRYIASV
jgi:hypothetical protein